MKYTSEDVDFVETECRRTNSEHLAALLRMIKTDSDYGELFAYGSKYLPQVRTLGNDKVDLDLLRNYKPVVLEYFNVLSDLPSLPEKLKELATDLAIYANGESIQIDPKYFSYNPIEEIKKALE